MVAPELSERAQYLFKILVEHYIKDGQPVGSRTLAKRTDLELSPATIRNVMADLEEMGLVRAPHTSAGRVPTNKGYRFFVDSLLSVKDPSVAEVESMGSRLAAGVDMKSVVQRASNMLSDITHLAGVVMVPRTEFQTLRHVEFLNLSDNRVLVILVFQNNEVQNRIIATDRQYTAAELQQAANYINARVAQRELSTLRKELLGELGDVRRELDRMMQAVVEMAEKTFDTDAECVDDYILAGETNLMDINELSDLVKLRKLFEAFNQKRDIIHLLDQAIRAQGIQIFIGEESGYEALDNCSVVTSAYQADGIVMGVLGIIGPTRMSYEHVIPIVDLTAKMLGSALKSLH